MWFGIAFFLVLFLEVSTRSIHQSPESNCIIRCHENNTYSVNCSGTIQNDINKVNDFKDKTFSVICSHCHLETIPEFLTDLKITHLDLSFNNIEYLNKTIFTNFKNLDFLDLSNNNIINFNKEVLPENLRTLNLSGNRYVFFYFYNIKMFNIY